MYHLDEGPLVAAGLVVGSQFVEKFPFLLLVFI